MAKRRRRATPELIRQANEATERMKEIYERYTIEAICERLGPRSGGWPEPVLKEAISAEMEKMFAEYHQIEEDYGLSQDSLTDVAMEHLHGRVRVPKTFGTDGGGSHRMGPWR